jgi:hypothetical protein
MPQWFTAITHTVGCVHVSQHEADSPQRALVLHIGAMPLDDGTLGGAEIEWLSRVANSELVATLVPVAGCQGTWLWVEGAHRNAQYATYVVRTSKT